MAEAAIVLECESDNNPYAYFVWYVNNEMKEIGNLYTLKAFAGYLHGPVVKCTTPSLETLHLSRTGILWIFCGSVLGEDTWDP